MILFFLACTPLVGEWSGDVTCSGYSLPVTIELEWEEGRYVGDGQLDCSNSAGESCNQVFDIEVEPGEIDDGEQELDIDLDDCEATVYGFTTDVACTNPSEAWWDGKDEITGEWDNCSFELERED